MKVVFMKDLEGQGKRGETKNVKPGHARNYLLPGGFAVLTTDPRGKSIVALIEKEKLAQAEEIENLKNKISELGEVELTFKRKLTQKGGLFSAVKITDIVKEFEAKTKLKADKVLLEEPIKEVGSSKVEVVLSYSLSTFIAVNVIEEK